MRFIFDEKQGWSVVDLMIASEFDWIPGGFQFSVDLRSPTNDEAGIYTVLTSAGLVPHAGVALVAFHSITKGLRTVSKQRVRHEKIEEWVLTTISEHMYQTMGIDIEAYSGNDDDVMKYHLSKFQSSNAD